MMEEDDWQFMLAQDPAYLLWMLQQELQYKGEQMQKEHSESILASMSEKEFWRYYEED